MNHITIELCAEDRARLDRLAEAMERQACSTCQPTAIEPAEEKKEAPVPEVVAEPTPTKTVDRAELRAKVIELSAKGLKEQTRDIVRAYAQTVTSVPEDKVAECFEKLIALEGKC